MHNGRITASGKGSSRRPPGSTPRPSPSGGSANWRGYMRVFPCPACKGKRLKDKVLAVRVSDKSIIDVTDLSVSACLAYLSSLRLTEKEEGIARHIIKEIRLAALSGKGRPRVPHAFAECRDALGRRGAADPARHPDRIEPDGRALRARRALHRPPPAGQPETHRDAPDAPRHRKHPDRGGARRGHDPLCRPRDRYRARGGLHGGRVIAEGTPLQIEKNKKSLTRQYLAG